MQLVSTVIGFFISGLMLIISGIAIAGFCLALHIMFDWNQVVTFGSTVWDGFANLIDSFRAAG